MPAPQVSLTEGNKGNEGEGGQAVVQAWLERHAFVTFVSFCEKVSSRVRIRSAGERFGQYYQNHNGSNYLGSGRDGPIRK